MLLFPKHMDGMYAQIGGFTVKFSLKNEPVDSRISYLKNKAEIDLMIYLRSFLLTSPKKIDFEIELCDLGDPELVNLDSNKKVYTPLYQWDTKSKIITYYQNNISQLETVLKHALLSMLKLNGGFGIHSSVSKVAGSAYLFLGESGAGKSTTVELLKDKFTTINDDITLIKRVGKKYYVFQTPFIEKAWWIKKTKEFYPVSKIFFLHKSTEFKVQHVSGKRYITSNIHNQVIAAQSLDKNILKNVDELIKNTNNFYDLYFAKDQDKLIKIISHV